MNTQLLLPLAVLSIVGLISFFVERAAVDRELKLAMAEKNEYNEVLKLLRREIRDIGLGGGVVFVPFIILTLIGSVPKWVVMGAWVFVATSIIRLPLVHFSRGRGAEANKNSTILFLPFAPIVAVSVPLIVIIYAYTLFETVRSL